MLFFIDFALDAKVHKPVVLSVIASLVTIAKTTSVKIKALIARGLINQK